MIRHMGAIIQAPVLLTGYDVKRCQRRVHNDHDVTLEKQPWEPPADLQKRFDEGRAFEADVFATLRGVLGAQRRRDLSEVRGKLALIDATVAAMSEGVELIMGGWLPTTRRAAAPAGRISSFCLTPTRSRWATLSDRWRRFSSTIPKPAAWAR